MQNTTHVLSIDIPYDVVQNQIIKDILFLAQSIDNI